MPLILEDASFPDTTSPIPYEIPETTAPIENCIRKSEKEFIEPSKKPLTVCDIPPVRSAVPSPASNPEIAPA